MLIEKLGCDSPKIFVDVQKMFRTSLVMLRSSLMVIREIPVTLSENFICVAFRNVAMSLRDFLLGPGERGVVVARLFRVIQNNFLCCHAFLSSQRTFLREPTVPAWNYQLPTSERRPGNCRPETQAAIGLPAIASNAGLAFGPPTQLRKRAPELAYSVLSFNCSSYSMRPPDFVNDALDGIASGARLS